MKSTNDIARQLLILLQRYIQSIGFTPAIHFELEGCFQFNPSHASEKYIDFSLINSALKKLNINGELISEYWNNQWEFVSSFDGQLPLEEADNLTKVISCLPKLLEQQAGVKTLIKPVVWAGDRGKLAPGCTNIFSGDSRAVHIPNAIQLNVSVRNNKQENIICQAGFGEYLQQRLLIHSLPCSLLYLPEEEAFERFALKSTYGLAEELCSPIDISGGHQGSIGLYKKIGKHNQAMGETTLLYDHQHRVLVTEQDWQTSARIEHRLGASSLLYNAYVNVIFTLLNVIDALDVYLKGSCQQVTYLTEQRFQLPTSLYTKGSTLGAIDLFKGENWFAEKGNHIAQLMGCDEKLGEQLKQAILKPYQTPEIIT